jgi:hypothetical protein
MKKFKLAALWVVAFCGLFLFTGVAFGHLTGMGTTQAYAQTVKSHSDFRDSRNFVEVDGDGGDNHGMLDKLGGDANTKMICSVTPLQAAELDAFFHVKEFNFQVDGNVMTVERVSGHNLTKKQLKDFLKASDASLNCHVIGGGHVFFLPLIPHIS